MASATRRSGHRAGGLSPWRTRARARLFALHSALGAGLGAVLLVLSLTGSALVFRRELDWLLTPSLRCAPSRSPASPDAVLRSALASEGPTMPWELRLPEGPRHAWSVRWHRPGHELELFVHPDTARVQGRRSYEGLGPPLDLLRQVHVRLLLGRWGRALVGALGALFTLLTLAGWLLSRRVRRGQTPRARLATIHRRVAALSLPLLLLLASTGALLGLQVLPRLLSRTTTAPPVVSENSEDSACANGPRPRAFERALALARRALPEATAVALRPRSARLVRVMLTHPSPWLRRGGSVVDVDLCSGSVREVLDAREAPAGERAWDALEPLHFGYAGEAWGSLAGVLVRALWSVAGLALAALCFTGLRMRSLRARRRDEPDLLPKKPTLEAQNRYAARANG